MDARRMAVLTALLGCATNLVLAMDPPESTGLSFDQAPPEAIAGFLAPGTSSALQGKYLGQTPPGKTPKLFAPGIVNTADKNHSTAAVSLDGDEIYWSLFSEIEGVRQERIWFTKLEGGGWTTPMVAPFSGEHRDGQPSFSPDGHRLLFASQRPVGAEGGSSDANIWYIDRRGGLWGEPVCLGPVVNSEDQEWFPTVARNGNLYFGFFKRDSPTLWDIYRSEYVDGEYRTPERLGDAINSRYVDMTPYIDPDERFLIFFSERPEGTFETGKLFISFRRKDGSWTSATALGDDVNSAVSRFPGMSLDGRYFFFTNMQSGSEDVYWVDSSVIHALIPGELNE